MLRVGSFVALPNSVPAASSGGHPATSNGEPRWPSRSEVQQFFRDRGYSAVTAFCLVHALERIAPGGDLEVRRDQPEFAWLSALEKLVLNGQECSLAPESALVENLKQLSHHELQERLPQVPDSDLSDLIMHPMNVEEWRKLDACTPPDARYYLTDEAILKLIKHPQFDEIFPGCARCICFSINSSAAWRAVFTAMAQCGDAVAISRLWQLGIAPYLDTRSALSGMMVGSAASNGHVNVIKELQSAGVNFDEIYWPWAEIENRGRFIDTLDKAGLLDKNGMLIQAVAKFMCEGTDAVQRLEELMQLGLDLHQKDKKHNNSRLSEGLIEAALIENNGSVGIIDILQRSSVTLEDMRIPLPNGVVLPLAHAAVAANKIELITKLTEVGVRVDQANGSNGETPAHIAVSVDYGHSGQAETVRALGKSGVDFKQLPSDVIDNYIGSSRRTDENKRDMLHALYACGVSLDPSVLQRYVPELKSWEKRLSQCVGLLGKQGGNIDESTVQKAIKATSGLQALIDDPAIRADLCSRLSSTNRLHYAPSGSRSRQVIDTITSARIGSGWRRVPGQESVETEIQDNVRTALLRYLAPLHRVRTVN